MEFFKKHSNKINILFAGIIIGCFASFFFTGNLHFKTAEAGNADVRDMQYTFREVAEKVRPFVVEIRVVEVKIQEMPEGYSWPFNFIEPEEDSESGSESQEYETEGLGSGIIVKRDQNKYYVLTNNHVIGDADRISIRLFDQTEVNAEIQGIDERKDLALLVFESEKDLDTAVLGDSDDLFVGDWVLAVGSPLGYDSTVTAGIVSAIGRNGPENNISDFIQTDASINQGNSGGALVNLDGEVVGINTWIATNTGVSIGLGFSIPVNNIKNSIDDFIESGSVQYGWLGVIITSIRGIEAEQMGLTGKKGAFVYNIYENSPAGKAGVLPGDFITALNEEKISDYKHFTRLIGDIKAGEQISIDLIRNQTELRLSAVIELRKEKSEIINLYDEMWPGITPFPLDDSVKKEFGISSSVKGVVISVNTGTRAYNSGLKNYDIITEINGLEINNMMDFYRTINDKSNSYKIKLIRNNEETEIELIR